MINAFDTFRAGLSLLEMPLDGEDMVKELKDSESAALSQYRGNAMGDASAKFEAELLGKIEEEKSLFRKKNKSVSKETCERLLQVRSFFSSSIVGVN